MGMLYAKRYTYSVNGPKMDIHKLYTLSVPKEDGIFQSRNEIKNTIEK